MTYEDLIAQMTGPEGPFALAEEEHDGRMERNFPNRERSLREKVANAGARGDQECIVYGEQRYTYGQFAQLVWGVAHGLLEDHGLQRGDRVAILATNRPEWLFAAFGSTSAAGVGVALNGWWQTEELEYALNDSGSRFLVVDEKLYPKVAPLLSGASSVEKVFYIGENAPEGTIPFDSLLKPREDVPTVPIDEDDPFMILYTSGTTGRSKGCITTHRGTITQVLGIMLAGIANSMLTGAELIPTSGQACSLLTSPLFHVAAMHASVCTQLTTGMRMVFLEGKFEPEKVMALIEREKISMWAAVPAMFHRLVHSPEIGGYDLSSLKSVTCGGAPTAPETLDKATEVLPVVPSMTNAYGLTETHGVATTNSGRDLLGKKTSAGRPAAFLDCVIKAEDGSDLGRGTLGEVCFFGPTITPGYWNRPDATAETIRDGWLHTGDLGYIDDEGFLYIVDRAKDMILRGGENVYCVEIENCLADHDGIDEAAVIGKTDPELGERVHAIVRLVEGAQLDVAEVQKHVAAHLAGFKVPEFVTFTGEPIPRNPAGKILKNELRERFG